jgi:phospholipid-binding lipoprotein MlaA
MMLPHRSLPQRLRAMLLCVAVCIFVLGCASTGNPRDPFEPINRGIYKFNDTVDGLLIKPAATLYRDLLPELVRTGISNFFSNINDVIVALNNLMQGKVEAAINDAGRVLVNTTLGVLGVMDPATKLGVEKNNEDFGQTLGFWGLGDGPYIVLPFLGPSNLRDTVGWVGDTYTWPVTYLEPNSHRNALIGLRFVGARADLLEASKILETAALDPYEFVRDAYLQRRRNLVYDGNPPDDSGDDIGEKPSTRGPANRPSVAAAVGQEGVSGAGSSPSPAGDTIGDREPAAREEAPAQRQDAGPEPETSQETGKVRVWLPEGRD